MTYRLLVLFMGIVLEATEIRLAPPFNDADREYSAMAWNGKRLVVVPQYPDGHVYTAPRKAVIAALDGQTVLHFSPLRFDDRNIRSAVSGYEGYEAIAFDESDVYALIEAGSFFGGMHGYIVKGSVGKKGIVMHQVKRIEVPLQIDNFAFETLVIADDALFVLFEANGVTRHPVAYRIDKRLEKVEPVGMEPVDYRITDASAAAGGRFWCTNVYWPGDGKKLKSSRKNAFAQLIELRVGADKIERTGRSVPILDGGTSHNYEGMVLLGKRGALLITDRYPGSLLHFVPFH